MPGLGERFRAAREARGLSLSDVAEQIRIRSVYLAAIEEENWGAIGAPVYARGFLRTYARFLGLDPEEVVAEFNGAPASPAAETGAAPSRSTPVESVREPSSRRSLAPLIWIAGVIAVALVAFVFYNALTMSGRGSNASVAVSSAASAALPSNSPGTEAGVSPSPGVDGSAAPSPSPGVSASPGLDGPSSLEVRLSAPSWLRVTVDGNVSMEGTFPAGTAKLFHGKTARLRIGNAGGVEVVVDGKSLGKLGATGDVIERSFTL